MRILVTGGAGFIGSHVVAELKLCGHDTVSYDNYVQYKIRGDYDKALSHRARAGVSVRGDTRDYPFLRKTFEECKPEVIIHLAALPLADMSDTHVDECRSTIVDGTTNVLQAARETGVRRVVYISSSMVYGDFEREPIDEYDNTKPIDVYGGCKLAGEHITRALCRRFGLEHHIIRPSAVYGPTDVNRRVTQIFLDAAIEERPITLYNGGEERLDFTYVTHTAHGIVLAALAPGADATYNITAECARSLKDLADIIRMEIPVEVVSKSLHQNKPQRGTLSNLRARTDLGYQPQHSLHAGIVDWINWRKANGWDSPL
jgi:UDP-glucose 4-epimerase